MMKSWKTTTAGLVAAACAGLTAYGQSTGNDTLVKIAPIIATFATAAIGLFARDFDKTSEDHNLTPPKQ